MPTSSMPSIRELIIELARVEAALRGQPDCDLPGEPANDNSSGDHKSLAIREHDILTALHRHPARHRKLQAGG